MKAKSVVIVWASLIFSFFAASILDGTISPYVGLIAIPLLPLMIVIWKSLQHCIICGLASSDKDYSNPDRKMKINYNLKHFNDDYYSRRLRWRMRSGSLTCAACTKRLQDDIKANQ